MNLKSHHKHHKKAHRDLQNMKKKSHSKKKMLIRLAASPSVPSKPSVNSVSPKNLLSTKSKPSVPSKKSVSPQVLRKRDLLNLVLGKSISPASVSKKSVSINNLSV